MHKHSTARLLASASVIAAAGVAVAMFSTAPVTAQTTTAITSSDLVRRVGVLAHDSMLGRDAGQIGNVRATSYVARELQRLGLRPAGTDGFMQRVPLVTRGPVRDARLSIAGAGALAPSDMQSVRAPAGSPFGGTFAATSAPTIFGGFVGGPMIDPARVRGRIVVIQAAVDARGNVGGEFAGDLALMRAYDDAAGILFVGLERMSPQTRSSLRLARYTLADPPLEGIPAALITAAAAARIFNDISFAELEIGAAGASVSGVFGMVDTPTPQPARNVVAIVPGTDAKLRNEFVAIGAHTDHVGVGVPVDHDSVRIANSILRPLGANGSPAQPRSDQVEQIRQLRAEAAGRSAPRRDSIFNGADDNASGVAVVLEMAEYFARNPQQRSLLFVFHTAEEKGLFGAQYYTDHPTVPRDAIVAHINLDQVSRGGPEDVTGSEANTVYLLGTRRLSTQLGDLVERVNASPGHNLRLDYTLDQPMHRLQGYCRSDHYMYARYSIPVIFMSAGWHRDYHMVSDEAQYTQPQTMLNIGELTRDVVSAIASLSERPLVDQPRPDPAAACVQ